MLTNGLTGTTEATATTTPNTSIVNRVALPLPPTQAHQVDESSRPTIRPHSGDPLLTRCFVVAGTGFEPVTSGL